MKLYIDTTNREKITIRLDEKKFETEAKKESSQKLLPFIDEILKRNKITINSISEIEVNTGPGSFTGIRIGVAVANTLANELNVPVNGKKLELEIKY